MNEVNLDFFHLIQQGAISTYPLLICSVIVVAVALVSLRLAGASTLAMAASIGAGLFIGAGVAVGRDPSPAWRERAWEVQAIGVALLAAAWLWGIDRLG